MRHLWSKRLVDLESWHYLEGARRGPGAIPDSSVLSASSEHIKPGHVRSASLLHLPTHQASERTGESPKQMIKNRQALTPEMLTALSNHTRDGQHIRQTHPVTPQLGVNAQTLGHLPEAQLGKMG